MTHPQTNTIVATVPAIFNNDLSVRNQDMRSLYEKAKRDQWNASTDIHWEKDFNPEQGVLPDGLIDVWHEVGTPERAQSNSTGISPVAY
jgi:hypothetical protein